MRQLDFPNPPNRTHYKQGMSVNQRALITLLPTIVLSKLRLPDLSQAFRS